MRKEREHPTQEELEEMDTQELIRYALREENALLEQKQTPVPRLLREMRLRLAGNA